jgi:general secretion pathway protein D
MQRMHKQVLIEAKLIEVVYNKDHTTGIDWSKFALEVQGSREGYDFRHEGVGAHNFGSPN